MKKPLLATGFFFSFVLPLQAQTISSDLTDGISGVYTFGDSLSDPGNLYNLTEETVPQTPPYAQRFSNGEVWVEYLAADLGLTPTPFTEVNPLDPPSDGINFAIGGASTGGSNTGIADSPTGVLSQIGIFQDLQALQPNSEAALYVYLAGANDFAGGDAAPPATDIAEPIGNVETAVRTLFDLGAQNFLVSNLPDLAFTPLFLDSEFADDISSTVAAYNLALAQSLENLRGELPGINIAELDFETLFAEAITNPAQFGFTDVETPCLTNFSSPIDLDGFNVCGNPDETLFWDDFHPTTTAHDVFGQAALETVQSDLGSVVEPVAPNPAPAPSAPESVPEPAATVGILAFGFSLGIGSLKSKRRIS